VGSLWKVHEKPKEEGAEAAASEETSDAPEEEITAMLVKFRSPMGMIMMPRYVNEQTSMQAGMPAFEINRLNEQMGGWHHPAAGHRHPDHHHLRDQRLRFPLQFPQDRKYELAIMRSLGASQSSLFSMIILEGLILAGLGFVLGLLLSRGAMAALASLMADSYRYQFSATRFLRKKPGCCWVPS
jgi:putative ABC transport system permease protein